MGEPGPGDYLGSYHLEATIGQGGVARLFRGRHVSPVHGEQLFALKVLQASSALEPEFVSRFRREAYLLSTLRHPNIVETFEAGVQGDELYIAMELIHGRDFGDILDQLEEPLPQVLALHVVREILEALDYAHNLIGPEGEPAGVIHLDIKPSNVLVAYDGRVKLTDFGVAALLAESGEPDEERTVMGTTGYFAPEQLEGGPVDHRADIFGVGVLMYEALCGQQPFDAERTSKVLRQNRRASLPRPRKVNPSLSPEVEAVLLRALERRPQRRYASCRQMLEDLRSLAPHRSGMSLALGSFLRAMYVSAADFVGGPWQRQDGPGSIPEGTQVLLFTNDQERGRQLEAQLSSLGVHLLVLGSPGDLTAEAQGSLRAIIVDVDDQELSAPAVLAFQACRPRPVPTLTLSAAFEPRAVALADAVGAMEMLALPLQREVLREALRRALNHVEPEQASTVQAARQREEVRGLLVTGDAATGARLVADFKPWGFETDLAPSPTTALQEMESAVHHFVILDQASLGATSTAGLLEEIRGLPGVGLIPLLILLEDELDQSRFTLPARCSASPRGTSTVILASRLNQLRGVVHLGRTFRRMPAEGLAELSYLGKSLTCELVNISRGGVLLLAEQMPALGTPCHVTLHPGGGRRPFTLEGRVVRLDFDEKLLDQPVGVAVAFTPSVRSSEAALIALVREMATQGPPLLTPPPRKVPGPRRT